MPHLRVAGIEVDVHAASDPLEKLTAANVATDVDENVGTVAPFDRRCEVVLVITVDKDRSTLEVGPFHDFAEPGPCGNRCPVELLDEAHRETELRERAHPADTHPRLAAVVRLCGQRTRDDDVRGHLLHRLDVQALVLAVVEVGDAGQP